MFVMRKRQFNPVILPVPSATGKDTSSIDPAGAYLLPL